MAEKITEVQAKQIYQDLLDRICDAYFDNDFEAFKAALHVPHSYATEGEERQIQTYDQMREAFDCFRDYLTGVGVTHFIRTCTGAMQLGHDKIIGGHMTETLRDGTRLRQPYEVWATLQMIHGKWMVISSENAISDTSWQALAFRQGAEKVN